MPWVTKFASLSFRRIRSPDLICRSAFEEKLRLKVIIPTYNEAENLPRLVSALFLLPLDVNILVVDDNSPDGTGGLAEKLSAVHPGKMSVIHRPGKLGLRSAYLEGFKHAMTDEVDVVVQMDADYSHDPACLEAMTKRL